MSVAHCFSGLVRGATAPPPEAAFAPSALDELAPAVHAAFGDGGVPAWHTALLERPDDDPLHHAAVFLYGLAAHETLLREEEPPAALYGDSLGVYGAIAATRAIDPVDGVRLVLAAGDAIRRAQAELGHRLLAVTGLARDTLEGAVAGRDRVRVTHVNSSLQFLLSGPSEALEEIAAEAERRGAFTAGILDLPGVVHRRELAPYAGEFLELLGRTSVGEPLLPLYSCVTAEMAADSTAIRACLEDQLFEPVLLAETVEAVSDRGVDEHVVLGSCPELRMLLAWTRPDDAIRFFPAAYGEEDT